MSDKQTVYAKIPEQPKKGFDAVRFLVPIRGGVKSMGNAGKYQVHDSRGSFAEEYMGFRQAMMA